MGDFLAEDDRWPRKQAALHDYRTGSDRLTPCEDSTASEGDGDRWPSVYRELSVSKEEVLTASPARRGSQRTRERCRVPTYRPHTRAGVATPETTFAVLDQTMHGSLRRDLSCIAADAVISVAGSKFAACQAPAPRPLCSPDHRRITRFGPRGDGGR